MFIHIEAIFLILYSYYPDIIDFSKKLYSCIDTSVFTVVFMHQDFQ